MRRRPLRALLGLLLGVAACSEPAPAPPNLILVSLDTLRADRLGAYGYERPTSPAIDALALRGARFSRAYSTASWTLPAHMSLFTGLTPERHTATRMYRTLPEEIPTLVEVLRARGYRTFGYTAGGFVASFYGFGRGFESYSEKLNGVVAKLGLVRERIESLPPDEPYFIFLHTFTIHCPYPARPRHREAFRTQPPSPAGDPPGLCLQDPTTFEVGEAELGRLSDRYDAAIRTADEGIGDFVRFLDARDELRETYLVLLSDHGEEFGEHGGIFHGHTLYDELLRVPFIVVGGETAPGVIDEPIALTDFMPTILDLLGLEGPTAEGRSVAELIRNPAARLPTASERPLFSAVDRGANLRGLISGRYKLVLGLDTDETRLFDLEADPEERRDIAEAEPEVRDRLRERIDRHLGIEPRGEPQDVDLPEDHVEQLRALGYVE